LAGVPRQYPDIMDLVTGKNNHKQLPRRLSIFMTCHIELFIYLN